MMRINIAIDGPTGSGKGTTAKLLAKKLQYNYLDTGAMYRAVAYAMNEKEVTKDSFKEEDLKDIRLDFDNENQIMLNSQVIEQYIRTPIINKLSSDFAVISQIRKFLSKKQQEIVSKKGYVAEGRDIGSVIMPDAQLKIYLNASVEKRTTRRLKDFEKQGLSKTFDEVKKIIEEKDFQDMNRQMDPLRKLPDAIEVDTSNITIDEQVEIIYNLVQKILMP